MARNTESCLIEISTEARQNLKILAAQHGITMKAMVAKLVDAERFAMSDRYMPVELREPGSRGNDG